MRYPAFFPPLKTIITIKSEKSLNIKNVYIPGGGGTCDY
jgi:hypothetical protein